MVWLPYGGTAVCGVRRRYLCEYKNPKNTEYNKKKIFNKKGKSLLPFFLKKVVIRFIDVRLPCDNL